jgi:hypothetical protein
MSEFDRNAKSEAADVTKTRTIDEAENEHLANVVESPRFRFPGVSRFTAAGIATSLTRTPSQQQNK